MNQQPAAVRGRNDTTMVNPLVWLVRPLFAPPRDFRDPDATLFLPRFPAWRRSLLLLVLVCPLVTAAIDSAIAHWDEPRRSFTILLKLESDAEAVPQTLFGDVADWVWVLAFYAMPASAL